MAKQSFHDIAQKHTRPRTKRLLVNGPADYKTVEVRPDMSVIMKDATLKSSNSRIGITFLAGEQPCPFDFEKTELSLAEKALPIVMLKTKQDSIQYEQTVFTANRRIYIEMSVKNASVHHRQAVLWLSMIQTEHSALYDIENEDYLPYHTKIEPWLEAVPLRQEGNYLFQDDRTSLYYTADDKVKIEYTDNKLMHFLLELAPGKMQKLRVIIPYECLAYVNAAKDQEDALAARAGYVIPSADAKTLLFPSFDKALKNALHDWQTLAAGGMQIKVPEPVAQLAFEALKLSCLQMLAHPPEQDYFVPGQGGFNDFSHVYGWESSFMMKALDFMGFSEYTKRVLDYFMRIQSNRGPDGDIRSIIGAFRPSIHWMSETGSILGIFGRHYLFTRDDDWFSHAEEAMRAACRWIQNERAATKEYTGKRPAHYGLLPIGRVHDWPDRGYFFFSDCNTYAGLRAAADAFTVAGSPDAQMWQDEAEDYRRCILDAFDHATHQLSEGKLFFANEVYGKPGPVMTSYGLDGPLSLIAGSVLKADDPRVPLIEQALRHMGIMEEYFACRLPTMEDEALEDMLLQKSHGAYRLYYVTTSEMTWYRTWLERGETDKAQTYLFSTLAFSTASDTAACAERYCPELPWLLPWQPNGSGNGRVLTMLCDTLFYEQDGFLHLLPGVPDEWLYAEGGVQVKNGLTSSVAIDFTAQCRDRRLTMHLLLRWKNPILGIVIHASGRRFERAATDGESEIVCDLL